MPNDFKRPVSQVDHRSTKVSLRKHLLRESLKGVLSALWSWSPLQQPLDGYSIVIGVPWELRELLRINLRFIEKCDLTRLGKIICVFDRVRQPGGEEFFDKMRDEFPELPLDFYFQPYLAGRYVRWINKSHFYANLNWTVGIQRCCTRYAVLHDFDLFPSDPKMFRVIAEALQNNALHFSGLIYRMDEQWWDAVKPPTIGSCELGIDVQWIRSHARAIDCYHKIHKVNGTPCNFDSFNYVQLRTERRDLVEGASEDWFVHVWNLCSTYLKYTSGEPFIIGWRLHMLWYLQDISGQDGRIVEVTRLMEKADCDTLTLDGKTTHFAECHVTCANVLRRIICSMEKMLFGIVRPEAEAYVDVTQQFLSRFGDISPLPDK